MTLPSRSSVLIPVVSDESSCVEVMPDGKAPLLLERAIGVSRGVMTLQEGRATVLVTNFQQEPQHLTKGTATGHIVEHRDSAVITALHDEPSSSPPQRTPPTESGIDLKLPAPDWGRLLKLLIEFTECFATSSRVRQLNIGKHRIVTVDDALYGPPLTVPSLRERE